MKVLFISPPLLSTEELSEREIRFSKWIERGNMYIKPFEPPLGIASIATFIKSRGYNAKIIDVAGSELNLEDVLIEVEKFNPQIIGISTLTPNYPNALILSKKLKENFPEILLVLGGVHPTLFPEEVLEECKADIVVRGEGEYSFLKILESYKEKDISVKKIFSHHQYLKSEDIPFPDYRFLPAENYIKYTEKLRGIKALPAMVTRGCPYVCSFCAVNVSMGKTWRAIPANLAAEKIIELANNYSLQGIWFKDSILNLNPQWMDKFSTILHSSLPDLVWQMNTRVDLIREEEINKLTERGLIQVDVGIEAGTEKSLKVLRKKVSLEDIRKAVRILKKYVRVSGFFMIGIPGESERDIWETVKFAEELELDSCSWSIFQPLPGSELFDIVRKRAFRERIDWKKIVFTETEYSWCNVPARRLKEIYNQINEGELRK